VFTGDSPTPFSPGCSAPGNATQPALAARALVTLSALDPTASPNDWVDDGVNETRGNSVVAQTNGQFRVPVDAFESQQFFRLRAP
jgi:hypothetical protein